MIDLSAYAGQTIYLAFRYEGDYMDEWYIDDVSLLGPCTLPAGGLIAGSVYNRYSHAPLTGATVGNQDGYTQTAQTTPADAALGESFYVLYSPAGSKTFTATVSGYAPVALDNVPVVAGETGRQDFLFGNAFVSQQTGDWSGSAWTGGTPTATDWVTITTGHTVRVDGAAAACYGLTIMPDGTLVIPAEHTLTAAVVDNQGTLRQTKAISGTGHVDFHLRDGGGNVSYYGLLFEAMGYNLGTTTVDIHGAVINGTGTLNQTVGRWFDIAPEYALAGLPTTFYYADGELNGNAVDTLDVYHYGGSGLWDLMTTLARGGSGAARYVTAEIGPDFSPFVLKSPGAPTAVRARGVSAVSGGVLALGVCLVFLGGVAALKRKRR